MLDEKQRQDETNKSKIEPDNPARLIDMIIQSVDNNEENPDSSVDVDTLINKTQKRLWKALKRRYQYDSNLAPAQDYLRKYVNSKIPLAILYVDLVGSTQMSMTISVDKLVTIIRAFSYEMTCLANAFGGFVLKYVGDAVISFFPSGHNKYLACDKAVRCGISMLSIIKNGLNPILNQYDYPELGVKIGVDEGENIIVQYGHDKNSPLDVLGYCMSVSAKMTSITEPNNITIGEDVFSKLHPELRERFIEVKYKVEDWKYVSKQTGHLYRIYSMNM